MGGGGGGGRWGDEDSGRVSPPSAPPVKRGIAKEFEAKKPNTFAASNVLALPGETQEEAEARVAVQNALVRLSVESEAAAGVSIAGMVVPGTEPRCQYEAGRALVGSLCAEMRFVCTTPYGEWEEDCQENTEEEYETEMTSHFAAAFLQNHLSGFLDREMMETTGRYHGLEARTGGIDTTIRSAPRVVTPCWDSSGSERSANDGKDRVAKEAEFGPVDKNEGGSTADSALDIASEWQHQAKKARKGKKRGVGRLHTGYSPGYGGSGRAIHNK